MENPTVDWTRDQCKSEDADFARWGATTSRKRHTAILFSFVPLGLKTRIVLISKDAIKVTLKDKSPKLLTSSDDSKPASAAG